MKRNLLTLIAISAIGAGGFAWAQQDQKGPHGAGGPGGWHEHGGGGGPLDHLTQSLNLTPDQQAKVQPIVDQAKPQLQAIHQEAMAKAKGVVDNAMTQIRPLLTPDQQTKADNLQKAHQDLHSAVKEMHDVQSK